MRAASFSSSFLGLNIAVVHGVGRLDLLSAAELRQTVRSVLATDRHRIVVDLSMVSRVDSTGLGALVSCWKAARALGGDLRICRPSPQVVAVLGWSSVDRLVESCSSVDDAY